MVGDPRSAGAVRASEVWRDCREQLRFLARQRDAYVAQMLAVVGAWVLAATLLQQVHGIEFAAWLAVPPALTYLMCMALENRVMAILLVRYVRNVVEPALCPKASEPLVEWEAYYAKRREADGVRRRAIGSVVAATVGTIVLVVLADWPGRDLLPPSESLLPILLVLGLVCLLAVMRLHKGSPE